MFTKTIKLSGLSCEACEKITIKKLSKVIGIVNIISARDKITFTITSNKNITQDEIQTALKDTSYAVLSLN